VQNLTSGKSVTCNITLTSLDTLVIDMLNRTITLNGTSNRRNTMTSDSQWWDLAPGNNTIAYHANTVSVGSTMAIAFQSAWT